MHIGISATAAVPLEGPEWAQWDAVFPKQPDLGREGHFPREEEALLVKQRNWGGAVGCCTLLPYVTFCYSFLSWHRRLTRCWTCWCRAISDPWLPESPLSRSLPSLYTVFFVLPPPNCQLLLIANHVSYYRHCQDWPTPLELQVRE